MKQLSPVERAIEYIEAHLDEDIGLSDVSRETGYSYYYMTRLFSSVLGESVGRYINRRRLYNASEKLIHSNRRIIDIALESGFESSEAFSRAFKAAFGSSPADYRKSGLDLIVNAKKELEPGDVRHIANNISRTPSFVLLEETKVAGIRGNTSLYNNRLSGLWRQFMDLNTNLPASENTGYQICETQQAIYEKDGDVTLSVMIGCPTDNFDSVPKTLAMRTISAGRYAVFTHRGALSGLLKSYQYIYGTWLPAAKAELDDRDDFEVYEREVVSMDDPGNEVKIFIPVK